MNVQNDEGHTPLHIVLYPEVAACLLDHGAEINITSYDGSTPLHTQVAEGEEALEVIELLLAHGANKQARDMDGKTPLDIARRREEVEIIELLTAVDK